jgi:predicted aldo/keto reductase-like oxidoreductase
MAEHPKDLNRREFLSKSAAGMASVGLLGLSTKELQADNQDTPTQEKKKKVIYRTLGKTGLKLPIVNMGVMNSSDPELVKRSFEIGVRHFDTAATYMRGRNEEILGKAVKDMNNRDKVMIATKIYIPRGQRQMSPESAKSEYLKIADECLQRLQTDYVDIMYSHNVDTLDWLNNPGILEALQILKEKKKARFIGFTTHKNMTECINSAVASSPYEVIEMAFNYAMSDDLKLLDVMKSAVKKRIGLVAMKTQCSQYWFREQVPRKKQKFYQGKIMHTAVLKWALRNDLITTAIPGYTNFQQMCVASCPHGVDIPSLMRTHMYVACYGNLYQAHDTLEEIPEGRSLDACAACGTCKAKCAHDIDIGNRIDELKATYV